MTTLSRQLRRIDKQPEDRRISEDAIRAAHKMRRKARKARAKAKV